MYKGQLIESVEDLNFTLGIKIKLNFEDWSKLVRAVKRYLMDLLSKLVSKEELVQLSNKTIPSLNFFLIKNLVTPKNVPTFAISSFKTGIQSPSKCLVWAVCLWSKGRNKEGRIATLTGFLIFDSYDMKSLWGKFAYDIFTGFKTASPQNWDGHFLVALWTDIEYL